MTFDGRRILRLHAGFLLLLTPTLTLATYAGIFMGWGPYSGFSDTPLVAVGLAQAYPLMGLVAVAIWIGSRGQAPWRYSVLAIAAHAVPLSALFAFWAPISESAIGPTMPLSLLIHGTGIAVEALSLGFAYNKGS